MVRSITELDDLTVNNVGVLKKINDLTLPAKYSDDWYKGALETDQIVKLAFYAELPVGGIKAKPINFGDLSNFEAVTNAKVVPKMVPNAVYIESLAVLKHYRNLAIGKELLSYVIEQTKLKFIHEIFLHVQVDNVYGIDWYKKQGFEEKDTVRGYYKAQGLDNPDAVVLSLKV